MHFLGKQLCHFKFCCSCQWSPTLIKGADSSFDTTLEGFCQPGKKEEVNKKMSPFVKMVGKKQHGLLR